MGLAPIARSSVSLPRGLRAPRSVRGFPTPLGWRISRLAQGLRSLAALSQVPLQQHSSIMFSYEKLPGLPRERVIEAIAPVLRSHGLVGVELVWRMDERGRVLQVTVERAPNEATTQTPAASAVAPQASAPEAEAAEGTAEAGQSTQHPAELSVSERGAGVTLDLCAVVSRDLSTALDVSEAIDTRYRLEVGTPGIDRALYTLEDYRRFRGRLVRLKLKEPLNGQRTVEGRLLEVGEQNVLLVKENDTDVSVPFESVSSGRLVIDWQALGFPGGASIPGRSGSGGRGSKRPVARR
jgi:ribosome maturation factor RimP